MLLPFMGLFMFFIPLAGFLLGIVLLFVRRLRFMVPFAFLVPLLGSYAALAGLWGTGLGLERMGFHGWIVGIAAWFGFVIGGGVGGAAGLGGGLALTLAVRRLRRQH
jgi:hypothetical protein